MSAGANTVATPQGASAAAIQKPHQSTASPK